jgi:hypothetical protein
MTRPIAKKGTICHAARGDGFPLQPENQQQRHRPGAGGGFGEQAPAPEKPARRSKTATRGAGPRQIPPRPIRPTGNRKAKARFSIPSPRRPIRLERDEGQTKPPPATRRAGATGRSNPQSKSALGVQQNVDPMITARRQSPGAPLHPQDRIDQRKVLRRRIRENQIRFRPSGAVSSRLCVTYTSSSQIKPACQAG